MTSVIGLSIEIISKRGSKKKARNDDLSERLEKTEKKAKLLSNEGGKSAGKVSEVYDLKF